MDICVEGVVGWPGVLCWVVMSVNVVCCPRAERRVCVCRGPEVTDRQPEDGSCAQVVRVRGRWFGRGEEVVGWPGVLCWVVMSVNVVCCTRADCRVCVCQGPEVACWQREWQNRLCVLVGGSGERVQGG